MGWWESTWSGYLNFSTLVLIYIAIIVRTACEFELQKMRPCGQYCPLKMGEKLKLSTLAMSSLCAEITVREVANTYTKNSLK